MSKGYVYVLSNPCMPGIVKIGRSDRRCQGLIETNENSGEGVPMPFRSEFEVGALDAVTIELIVRKRLAHAAVNSERGFYSLQTDEAIRTILSSEAASTNSGALH